jgi:NADPH2:quinone reductase
MRALLCAAFDGPDALSVSDIPGPVAGPGEVVVDVAYAALNFMDTLTVRNRYQFTPDLPFSPGAELSGRVAALGSGVDRSWLGARVAAWLGWGGCREKVAVPVTKLARLPEGLSDEAAAGIMVTYGTSLHALQDRARLQPGETLAVLGAAGGAGLSAVEIGAAMGARVIACASTPEKLETARAHGASDLVDYTQEDLKAALKRLGGSKGVDVVYDPVGGDLAEPALRSLGWKGRYLVVGFAGGAIPKIPLNLVLLKGCDILGVFWGSFTEREPAANAANLEKLFSWAKEGRISALSSKIVPLEGVADALRDLEGRRAVGKILVRPGPASP